MCIHKINHPFPKVPFFLQAEDTDKTVRQEESSTPWLWFPPPTNWSCLPRELCGKWLWGWVQYKRVLWCLPCLEGRRKDRRQGWCHILAIPAVSQYHEEIERWKKNEQLITILSWIFLFNKYFPLAVPLIPLYSSGTTLSIARVSWVCKEYRMFYKLDMTA